MGENPLKKGEALVKITEVRIFLKESPDKKLKAYVTITFDDSFVVRDLKIIEGNKGLFVAMPSKKAKDSCPKCHYKNVLKSKYCNQCGSQLEFKEYAKEDYQNEHRDIAHPITAETREYIQGEVLRAYEQELSKISAGQDFGSQEARQEAPEIFIDKKTLDI